MPEEIDYADCAYPPDIDLSVNKPAEAREYLRALVASNSYSEFVSRRVCHITVAVTPGLIAIPALFRRPLGGMRMQSSEMGTCALNMPGHDCQCSEPENEKPNPEAPLSAESVRIYLFKQR